MFHDVKELLATAAAKGGHGTWQNKAKSTVAHPHEQHVLHTSVTTFFGGWVWSKIGNPPKQVLND